MQTTGPTQRSRLGILCLHLRQNRLHHSTIEVEKGLLLLPSLQRHWLLPHAQPATTTHVGGLLHPQVRPRLWGRLPHVDWPLLLVRQHLLMQELLALLRLRRLRIQACGQISKLLRLHL